MPILGKHQKNPQVQFSRTQGFDLQTENSNHYLSFRLIMFYFNLVLINNYAWCSQTVICPSFRLAQA